MSRHHLYGLEIESDEPLVGPGLGGPPDVRVCRRESGWEPIDWRGREDWFRCRRTTGGTSLHWRGLADLVVETGVIAYRLHHPRWVPTFRCHLLPQALSFLLLNRGIDPLHGSALGCEGKAIGLVGFPGAGKSTLAAALVEAGWLGLGDDLLSIGERAGGFHLHPGFVHLKLMPSAAARFRVTASEPLLPGTKKRLWTPVELSAPDPVPLAALFLLEQPSARRRRIRCERLAPEAAFAAWLRHPFNAILDEPERWRVQFDGARRLAHSVPAWRLRLPKDLGRLGEAVRLVTELLGLRAGISRPAMVL